MADFNININADTIDDNTILGETVVIDDLIYLSNNGKWYLADANLPSKSTTELRLALAPGILDDVIPSLVYGYHTFTATIFSAGTKYWVSDNPGEITSTILTPDVVRYVGTAYSSTVMLFNPDQTYLSDNNRKVSGQSINFAHTHLEVDITDLDKYTQAEVDALIGDPLTTVGDIFVFGTTNGSDRLPVGTNGHVIVADSTEDTGLIWQAPEWLGEAPNDGSEYVRKNEGWVLNTGGAATGETNTASSAGTGVSLYKTKTGSDLKFNAVKSESNLLSIVLDAGTDDIEFTVNEANIVITESQISDLTHYTHPAHTVRSINTTGAEVLDLFTSDAIGSVTNITKRTMTLADLGYVGTVNANTYVHPTGDGNKHVPANSTTNNGKVLTSGAVAGTYTWETIPSGITDHTLLSNIGTNTHPQIDTHIADASIHFTEDPNWDTAFSWGDHDGLYMPIGKQLAQTKALVAGEYFTSYNSATGLFTSAPSAVSDHTLLTNIGTNTHPQIDSHIADSTIHYTQASISITESQVSDLGNYVDTSGTPAVNEIPVFSDADTITGSSILHSFSGPTARLYTLADIFRLESGGAFGSYIEVSDTSGEFNGNVDINFPINTITGSGFIIPGKTALDFVLADGSTTTAPANKRTFSHSVGIFSAAANTVNNWNGVRRIGTTGLLFDQNTTQTSLASVTDTQLNSYGVSIIAPEECYLSNFQISANTSGTTKIGLVMLVGTTITILVEETFVQSYNATQSYILGTTQIIPKDAILYMLYNSTSTGIYGSYGIHLTEI